MGTPRELRLDERLAFVELFDTQVWRAESPVLVRSTATGGVKGRASISPSFPTAGGVHILSSAESRL